MLEFIRTIQKRRHEEGGASAVEYGLLVAAIAAIIVVLVFTLGKYVKAGFQTTCDAMETNGAVAGADCTPAAP